MGAFRCDSSCRWELTVESGGKTIAWEPVSVPCRQAAAKRVAARGPVVFPAHRSGGEREKIERRERET